MFWGPSLPGVLLMPEAVEGLARLTKCHTAVRWHFSGSSWSLITSFVLREWQLRVGNPDRSASALPRTNSG
jgi:hypothetical protein